MDGRRGYRTRMPAARVLQRVPELSCPGPAEHRVIEGDNLQAMASLHAEHEGRVDVAYLDPPYNTGETDFAYSARRARDPNADGQDMAYVTNEDGDRHVKWLDAIGPRLWMTRELLAAHGICFVSISAIELFRLGLLMDELFGERNRLGVLVWKRAADPDQPRIVVEHEYVLCYAKREQRLPRAWPRAPLRGVIDIPLRDGSDDLERLVPGAAERFPNTKPTGFLERLLAFAAGPGALVLDPFAGSGTTGHAVLRLNARDAGRRRFVLIEEGAREERYARTLTAPRLRAAIEAEGLERGFAFETIGPRLDRRDAGVRARALRASPA